MSRFPGFGVEEALAFADSRRINGTSGLVSDMALEVLADEVRRLYAKLVTIHNEKKGDDE